MFSGRATNRDDPLVIGAAKILQRFVLYLPQLVARPSMSEQTHRPRLNELLTKARNNVIENTRNVTGGDISEYRPEDLQIIDRLPGERFRDAVRREQRRYESAVFGLALISVRYLFGGWAVDGIFRLGSKPSSARSRSIRSRGNGTSTSFWTTGG